jgi:hypothetical protein
MSFSYKIYNPNNIIINTRENYHIVPFGHRCSSALVAKYASLRKCSLPFDWCMPLFPQKIQHSLEDDLKNFIPDVKNKVFTNKYNFSLTHFNENIDEGIAQYKRRINRLNNIFRDKRKIYFIYVNENYLYDESYRNKKFNDDLFSQMLNLESFMKQKYTNINYTILYFNFHQEIIPKNSNIINIVLNTNKLYNRSSKAPWGDLRIYCGQILTKMFNTKFNPNMTDNVFYEE